MALEVAALGLAKTVAKHAATNWLGSRRARAAQELDLPDLVRERFPDLLPARTVERLFEGVADAVMRRLSPLLGQEFSDLDEPERLATIDAVVDTLCAARIDDTTLFTADADPEKLAADVRARVPDAPGRALLSESATRLYDLLLDECCEDYVRVLIALPPFVERTQVEELRRLSRIEQQVAEVLAQLPARSLHGPAGDADDGEFRREYLAQVLTELDNFDLYSADARNAPPKLSLGYVPLDMAADQPGPAAREQAQTGGSLRGRGADPELLTLPVAAETALSRAPRIFVRAEAGAGKTTLLRWLAVTAARGGFTGALAGWNGLVPFLVRLRGLPKGPPPEPRELIRPTGAVIASRMPEGWIDRLFQDGRALLLVDGVDEVVPDRRPGVRAWLAAIATAYPRLRIVVTARPTAAGRGWLEAAGFAGLVITAMSPAQLSQFITRWHTMTRETPGGAHNARELAACERALQQRLAGTPHLSELATNPLLAQLLCATNLDRGGHLPRTRMELYQHALDMLLHRRDTERGIEVEIELSQPEKLDLHADLAFRLTLYGRTELPEDDARRYLANRLATMPGVIADAQAVFQHLMTRCGVLRNPVDGRVDFMHRTFQEYLAAKAMVDQSHLDLLLRSAHLDTWRETIIMAVGHAGDADRARLLSGILDRADTAKRGSRRLRLLAIACLETATTLPDEQLRERLDECLTSVMPPRNRDEARTLAALGTRVLSSLPASVRDMNADRADACVRVAALVGGERAMRVLAGYNNDPRWEAQRSLLVAWKYFDPADYAATVLAEAELGDYFVNTNEAWRIPHLGSLNRLRKLHTSYFDQLRRRDLGELRDLIILDANPADIEHVAEITTLNSLSISGQGRLDDLSPLLRLPHLRVLTVEFDGIPDIDSWRLHAELTRLGAFGLAAGADCAALRRYPYLSSLILGGVGSLRNQAALTDLPLLRLTLEGLDVPGGLPALVTRVPRAEWLLLTACPWVSDLAALAQLEALESLRLNQCEHIDLATLPRLPRLTQFDAEATPVSQLHPLAACPSLETLWLTENPVAVDLATLPELPRLRHLDLAGTKPGLDLSPLAGRHHLTITLYEGQIAGGLEKLGRGVTIGRRPAPEGYDPASAVS